MKIVGLTGGIGSGKSTVAGIFHTLGIPVYESDKRAKELMNTNDELTLRIKELFGDQAYSNGELQSAWIAQQVFNNKSLLQKLNAIVHPAVKNDALQWAHNPAFQDCPYVIKESAILFEEHLTDDLTSVILVIAPKEIRISRISARDHFTHEQIENRMKNQWEDEAKIPLADFVIYNDGIRPLLHQVMDIDKMLRM